MYYNDLRRRYKVTNAWTGMSSVWIWDEDILIKELKKLYGYISDKPFMFWWEVTLDKDLRAVMLYAEDSDPERYLYIEDQFGRCVTPAELKTVYFDDEYGAYKRTSSHNLTYNRKKELREKGPGYRRDPVSGIHSTHGRYFRQISYKNTLIASDDDQCKEYGIPGYRKRRVLDAWDIEPVHIPVRSWKENYKVRKQWMIRSGNGTNTRSIRKPEPLYSHTEDN